MPAPPMTTVQAWPSAIALRCGGLEDADGANLAGPRQQHMARDMDGLDPATLMKKRKSVRPQLTLNNAAVLH